MFISIIKYMNKFMRIYLFICLFISTNAWLWGTYFAIRLLAYAFWYEPCPVLFSCPAAYLLVWIDKNVNKLKYEYINNWIAKYINK